VRARVLYRLASDNVDSKCIAITCPHGQHVPDFAAVQSTSCVRQTASLLSLVKGAHSALALGRPFSLIDVRSVFSAYVVFFA